jgi:hypothetical protein
MAAVTPECISDPVEVTVRATNVDALNSCSAYKINVVLKTVVAMSEALVWHNFSKSAGASGLLGQ